MTPLESTMSHQPKPSPSGRGLGLEIALTQLPLEELKNQGIADMGQGRVIARAFIADEGVCGVKFVPGKGAPGLGQRLINQGTALPPGMCGSCRPQIIKSSLRSSRTRSRL